MDEEDEDTSGYCSQSYTSMPLNKSSINWHNQNYMVRITFFVSLRSYLYLSFLYAVGLLKNFQQSFSEQNFI